MTVKPYFQDDDVVIYHGDCRDILPTLGPVDLVLTDPPYNVGIEYGAGVDDKRKDYQDWCSLWFNDCRQIAPLIALTPGIVNLGIWAQIEAPSWCIAWLKPAAMGRTPFGFCNWEPVLVWGKAKKHDGVDVITAAIIPDPNLDGHPCPKPLLWGKKLLALLTDASDVILDPFMGSGTTLRAAKDLGRKSVGIEIEERYCEIAARRMSQSVMALGVH